AAFLAVKKGLNTIILERKAKQIIGNKVCGDGIGTSSLNALSSIGMTLDKEKIVLSYPEEAQIIAPDRSIVNSFRLKKQIVFLNRYAFGQALLSEALNAGATLYERHRVQSVYTKEKEDIFEVTIQGKSNKFQAPAIIDASGTHSWLRDKSSFFPLDCVEWGDMFTCYREIVKLSEKNENPASLKLEFNQKIARGGYIWHFDRPGNEANVGVAIPRHRIGSSSPKTCYKTYIFENMAVEKVLDGRGGTVPSRHPLITHTNKNGIWLVGDAGLIVHPFYGAGLGSALHSGREAAISAVNFLSGDASPWNYNLTLLERYGKRYALIDFFRLLLHRLTDEEVNKSLHEGLLPAFHLFDIDYAELIKLCQKYEPLWVNAPIKLFQILPKYINKMNLHLQNYPQEFNAAITDWSIEYKKIYQNFLQA
ncbi:MAG: NAD(P)/FAD-dependent oxidoreductase, partial [Promethearchaeota archaeon]